MANIIKIKRSALTATPPSLSEGELAYSELSDNLFIGTAGSNLKKIGGNSDVTKLALLTLTGAVDLDTMDTDVAANNAKETNVTTNLTYTAGTRTIGSSDGTDAVITEVVAGGDSGLMTGSDKTKLNDITANAIADVVEDTTPQLGGNLSANGQQIQWSKGADVASAAALAVLTDGNYFDVTGTVTITSINTTAIGNVIKLHFDDAAVLTHNATGLVLPGAADILTAAGDEFEFTEYATGSYRCTGYALASGTAIVASGGTVSSITAGVGISGGTITTTGTIDLDFSELTDKTTTITAGTEFILQDGTVESRKAASEIDLGVMDSATTLFVSPALTSSPTAPTAAPGTNSTIIATTAYADAAVAAALSSEMSYRGGFNPTGAGTPDIKLAGQNTSTGDMYTVTVDADYVWDAAGSTAITATNFVVGQRYAIKTVGTTDFTLVGSANNTIGTIFTATGVGTGTGDVYNVSQLSTGDTIIAETTGTLDDESDWTIVAGNQSVIDGGAF